MTHDQEREKFEKWCYLSIGDDLRKDDDGSYISFDTDSAWFIWQAGWQAAKREPVSQEAMAKGAEPLAITAEMVERVAIHLATKESANCKTLDAAVNHVNNWKRLIPEAYEILIAATTPRGG